MTKNTIFLKFWKLQTKNITIKFQNHPIKFQKKSSRVKIAQFSAWRLKFFCSLFWEKSRFFTRFVIFIDFLNNSKNNSTAQGDEKSRISGYMAAENFLEILFQKFL